MRQVFDPELWIWLLWDGARCCACHSYSTGVRLRGIVESCKCSRQDRLTQFNSTQTIVLWLVTGTLLMVLHLSNLVAPHDCPGERAVPCLLLQATCHIEPVLVT
jgi:hypothetical protein